jgi:hypothetical protein
MRLRPWAWPALRARAGETGSPNWFTAAAGAGCENRISELVYSGLATDHQGYGKNQHGTDDQHHPGGRLLAEHGGYCPQDYARYRQANHAATS